MIDFMDEVVDVDSLKRHLSKTFDLVCFEDLATLRSKHRYVFDLFKTHWQSTFDPHQRLVLYSSHLPEQSFINHIQYAAKEINISNFFILFVCNHDISDLLTNANQRHGYDDTIMSNLQIALVPTQEFATAAWVESHTLCPMPFTYATVDQTGSARPCCVCEWPQSVPEPKSLRETFYGLEFDAIRQQMKLGQEPARCAACFHAERLGSTSLRQMMLSKHRRDLDEKYLDSPTLTHITVSPSTLCDFTCRICKPTISSKIRSEEIKFARDNNHKQRIQQMIPVNELEDRYLDEIVNITDLQLLHVLGGEPFLWPKLNTLIDRLIETGQTKQLRLEFNSNGNTFPVYLAKQVDAFQHIEILLSIDAVGTRFEIERGGSWPNILDNLVKFQMLNCLPKVTVKLAPTINIQNLLYLDDVVSLAHRLEFEIVWWYLKNPSFLCIDNVTTAVKTAVTDLYHNHAVPELAQLPTRMSLTPSTSGEQFLSYMTKLDQRREQVFSQSHQKICELMKIPL